VTSEVLIFNKRGVVVAADSAMTSSANGDDKRPRYAKTANKIFELSDSGSVAVAIYSGASVDAVPWELAIKLFRRHIGAGRLKSVNDYSDALVAFLAANPALFPSSALDHVETNQFEAAAVAVLKWINQLKPGFLDDSTPAAERASAWQTFAPQVDASLTAMGVKAPLTTAGLQSALGAVPTKWEAVVSASLASMPSLLAALAPAQLAEIAHKYRFAFPELLMGYTGVVVVGYGDTEIFPGYRHQHIYGHVGRELFVREVKAANIAHHGQSSMIVPLAQKSMIDQFTDVFSFPLWTIINGCSRQSLERLINEINSHGIDTTSINTATLIDAVHKDFMHDWAKQNWDENYHPLMGVLTTLSIEEMAHLAETLLVLQSLKERVTSSSEEVGGPIDVAAITKSEGLVWIKRKHYFGSELNQRYLARLTRDVKP